MRRQAHRGHSTPLRWKHERVEICRWIWWWRLLTVVWTRVLLVLLLLLLLLLRRRCDFSGLLFGRRLAWRVE